MININFDSLNLKIDYLSNVSMDTLLAMFGKYMLSTMSRTDSATPFIFHGANHLASNFTFESKEVRDLQVT